MESCGTSLRGRSRFIWLLFLVIMGVLFPQAKCQPGSLNIDCGSDENYYDSLGRYWQSDAKYISAGTSVKNITLDPTWSTYGHDKQMTSLRYFADPKHNRDCYNLPTKPATTYIVTSLFDYGNFLHNYTTSVVFSVYLNGSMWIPDIEMSYGEPFFKSPNSTFKWDAVVHSNGSVLNLCLVRKSGPSFISALQLRELTSNDGVYSMAKNRLLQNQFRIAFTDTDTVFRYPDDVYDRVWWPSYGSYNAWYGSITGNLTYIQNSTSLGQFDDRLAPEAPFPSVLQHAALDDYSQGITYTQQFFEYGPPQGDMFVTAYFLELDHNASDTKIRGIDYSINGQHVGTVNTSSSVGQVVGMSAAWTIQQNYLTIKFEKAPWSKLPPIINAMEIFVLKDYSLLQTADTDLVAMDALRQNLNLTTWTGDPCIPVPFLWINCTVDDIDPKLVRITSLMLSNMGLSGSLPTGILQFKKLTTLSLSSNNFTGSIPDDLNSLQELQFLSLSNNSFTSFIPDLNSLKHLQVLSLDNNRLTGPIPNLSDLVHLQSLTLQNNVLSGTLPKYLAGFPNFTDFQVDYNNFSGTVPSELIDKQNSGLHFTYTNNKYLRTSSSSSSKIGLIVGITAAVVASLLICWLTVWHFSTRKQRNRRKILKKMGINHQLSGILSNSEKRKNRGPEQQPSRSGHVVELSLEDIYKATKKFARKIGQGSFGPVYHGVLPGGQEVAVKVNAGFIQGADQFMNEVDLLSRIHHRNLVSLVGFCDEAQQEILVYTYLPNGSLCDHLYGTRSHEPLDWKTRLNIALNAAIGLEYLHVSCNPRIIHRDVKSSNILLDENWVAKISDFGISRQFETITGRAGSCVTGVETLLKGTPGYIDPDYLDSHKLTQKSDVYSFGVVLLEIISGHHPHVEVLPDGTARTLVQWAHASVKARKHHEMFDPILKGGFIYDAAIKVLNLAIRCTSRETAARPNMGKVVRGLMEAIKVDNSGEKVVGEYGIPRAPRRTRGQERGTREGSWKDRENNSEQIREEDRTLNALQATMENFRTRDPISRLENCDTADYRLALRSPAGSGIQSPLEIQPR